MSDQMSMRIMRTFGSWVLGVLQVLGCRFSGASVLELLRWFAVRRTCTNHLRTHAPKHPRTGTSAPEYPSTQEPVLRSLRPVRLADVDPPFVSRPADADAPWVAANLAVLNKRSPDIWLDVDLELLAAVRTRDRKSIVHVSSIRQ